MNTAIIGIVGKRGVGKDTTAQAIIIATNLLKKTGEIPTPQQVSEHLTKGQSAGDKLYWDFTLIAFADKIKAICSEMYGLHLGYFNDRTLKEKVIPGLGKSPRELLCHTGDILKTHFGGDVFVKDVMKGLSLDKKYIFTDVRYISEVTAIIDRAGVLIKVIRPGTGDGKHSSETEQDRIATHYVIDNNGSFEHLSKQVIEILTKINILK